MTKHKRDNVIGKYQLFGVKVEIVQADLDKLKPLLRSWNVLNDQLISFTEEDTLMKLLIIEQMTKARGELIRRVHSRLLAVRKLKERKELKL